MSLFYMNFIGKAEFNKQKYGYKNQILAHLDNNNWYI